MSRPTVALCALLALAAALVAADRNVYQLWQIAGWPLADLEELDPLDGAALATRFPAAIDETDACRIALGLWHWEGDPALGDGVPGVLDAPALPRAVGLAGALGPLSLRAGYVQRFNQHEQVAPEDTLYAEYGVGPWNSRLDGWLLQGAVPLELPFADGRRLRFRAGVGLEYQRLQVDQLVVQARDGAWARQIGFSGRLPLPGAGELALDYGWEDADGFVAEGRALFAGYPPSLESFRVYGRPPEAHHLRATLLARGGWWLSARLHQVRWSRMLLGYRDRSEGALVLGRRTPSGLSWQLGASSSGLDPRGTSGGADAWFLLAGAGWRRGPFSVDLKLADSHLTGSKPWREQTRLQLDLGWSWPRASASDR